MDIIAKTYSPVQLDPKCLNGNKQMAVDNRSRLIPCCHCDDVHAIKDPTYAKLLEVSSLDDWDNIEDIIMTPEWLAFEENLRNNIGPACCFRTCGNIRKAKRELYMDTATQEIDSENIK